MILAIDTGNTHTVLAIMDETQNKVLKEFRVPTYRTETPYGYAVLIKEMFEMDGVDPKEIDGVILSSVVPETTKCLCQALKLYMNADVLVVGSPEVKTGLEIRLEGGIAPDLEVGAVAVKELYPLPCAVVDMGTASTITVVDSDGAYLGGCIYPGAGLSLKTLTDTASLLPQIDIEAPKKAIATDTVDAMKAGIVYGEAGSVDGIVQYYEEELGRPFAGIVMTGGIGKLIAPYCRHQVTVDDDLLLKGLSIIYRKNC